MKTSMWSVGRLGRSSGYTIVEVMMFLVVTSALLVSGLAIFRGQQGRTQFTQSVRETEQQLRNILNEASVGRFPESVSGFTCSASGGSVAFNTSTSREQGANAGCIYLGKVLEFQEPDDSSYSSYTIAGRRLDGDKPVESLASAGPKIAPTLTQEYVVHPTIRATKVVKNESSEVAGFGFISKLNNYSNSDLSGSSQLVSLLAFGTGKAASRPAFSNLVAGITDSDRDIDSITICLEDKGSGGRKAAIVVGSNSGRELSIETFLDINNGEKGC